MADWIAALASLLSFVIALLVYQEAKRIRKNEIFKNLIDLWGQFNSIQLETGFYKRYGDFYQFNFSEKVVREDYTLVVWALFNALRFTWSSMRDNLLPEDFSRYQAAAWFYNLHPKREFLIEFMKENGVDPVFVEVFSDATSASSVREAKKIMDIAGQIQRK